MNNEMDSTKIIIFRDSPKVYISKYNKVLKPTLEGGYRHASRSIVKPSSEIGRAHV